MTGHTPIRNLPYVDPADPVADYPAVSQELATTLDTILTARWASGAAGLALPTAQQPYSVAVTFPVGRFTVQPHVTVQRYTAIGWNSQPIAYWASGITVNGFTLNGASNVSGGTANLGWIAVSAP